MKNPTTKRKPIGKRLRFDVFKRDEFVCQYCGGHPPKVILEVDHIKPIKSGGKNNIDNLITACFDCNRGKSCIDLSTIPDTLKTKASRIKEKEDQYCEYIKLMDEINERIQRDAERINDIYNSYYKKYVFTDEFMHSVRTFISKLGYYEVEDAIHKACSITREQRDASNQAIKYFCGICWRSIKGDLDKFKRF